MERGKSGPEKAKAGREREGEGEIDGGGGGGEMGTGGKKEMDKGR
jgi:hypothetical protein